MKCQWEGGNRAGKRHLKLLFIQSIHHDRHVIAESAPVRLCESVHVLLKDTALLPVLFAERQLANTFSTESVCEASNLARGPRKDILSGNDKSALNS